MSDTPKAAVDRRWAWYWGIWGLLGLYMASWDYTKYPYPALIFKLVALNLLQTGVWGVLGLFLAWLAKRRPIESFAWRDWRVWGLHLVASVFATVLGLFLAYVILILLNVDRTQGPLQVAKAIQGLPKFYQAYFHVVLLFMVAMVAAFHALNIYRRYKAGEVEKARLAARFAEAQNLALRMQLQPHFLFNTLHSISALVQSDPAAADSMISRLGDFLRMTLEAPPDQLVPLRKELAFIESYLAIERIRFQDRLTVRVEVVPDLLGVMVPSFILQPLVENALQHGLSDQSRGVLALRARRDSDLLVLEVQDSGEGFVATREGVGLSNVRARLGLIYKGRHHMDILGMPGRGTLVTLRLPMGPDPEGVP